MPIEKEAKSAEEAIEEICRELGKKKEELDFEVIEEKGRGLFGLIGNKRVKVRATLKEPVEKAEEAPIALKEARVKATKDTEKVKEKREVPKREKEGRSDAEVLAFATAALERIVAGIAASAHIEGRVDAETIYLTIKGDGSGLLIGRHGQTLDALQYLVGRIVGKQLGDRRMVVVDTEQYRERRRESLEQLARHMAEKAKTTGKSVNLQPMNASDRRIIHLTLKQDRGIETRSEGEGGMKTIRISPRKKG
jgi:spoIIIJ-associated protein